MTHPNDIMTPDTTTTYKTLDEIIAAIGDGISLEEGYASNAPCDFSGYCAGSSCPYFIQCKGD